MIFFADAEGTITRIIGEPIYQGSHKASRVVLVAPFSGVSVTVAFTLPNGVRTAVNLAEPNMQEIDLVGIYTQEGAKYNSWAYLLERSITEYAGTVSVQFFVYTATGEVISTFTTSLTIQKGVPTVLPELPTATVYEQILEYLAKVETRLNNVILFVSQLPTSNINTGAVYIVQKSATNYNAYVYSPAISAWVQINKSVVNVPAVSYMTDDSKIYYLTQTDGTNTVGLYGLIGNTVTRLLTVNDLTAINQAIINLDTKVTQLETKVTNVENEVIGVKADVTEAKANAQTALNASNTANDNAGNALEVANQALEKANSVTATFKPGGSLANISLLPPLTASNLGYVFDVADAFTTTADFLEGAGKEYPAGTNVAIIEPTSGVYKYDIFAGNFQPILESGVNIKTINNQSILGSGDLQIESGSDVIANPTLAGTEEKLTGLQVGETKYSVGDVGEITIEQTQILSETQIQLTEEQVNILKSCSIVYITLTGAGTLGVIYKQTYEGIDGNRWRNIPDISGDGVAKTTQYIIHYDTGIVNISTTYETNYIAVNSYSDTTIPLNTLRVNNNVYKIEHELPTVTSADSGKFLTVNSSGQWVATTVPNAETTSF